MHIWLEGTGVNAYDARRVGLYDNRLRNGDERVGGCNVAGATLPSQDPGDRMMEI